MKKLLPFLVLAFSASFCRLSADDRPISIPEVKLKDGRTLHSVQIVSYARNVVMARWDGGRGTIAYEVFPDDVQPTLEEHRPPPQSEDSVLKGEAAAKEYADKQHAAEIKRRAAAAITPGKDTTQPNTAGKSSLTADAAKKAIDAHNVIAGLTHEQVVQSWGQPAVRIPARNHGLEKWNYPDHNSAVVFDKDGIVTSVGGIESP